MEYLIGIGLAVLAGAVGVVFGMDRDRAFYPLILIVSATYYDLFAIMVGGGGLGPEGAATLVFFALAIVGYRTSLWVVVAALLGHGLFDLVHPAVIENPGVPGWWPMFCLSFDVGAAGFLAWRLRRGAAPVRHPAPAL